MSQRRKNRVRARQQTSNQRQAHGQQPPPWPTNAPGPAPANDPLNLSICDAIGANPTPPGGDGAEGSKSNYDNSRGNACKSGRRSRKVYPEEVADLIDQRTTAFIASMTPRDEWETFLVGELASASVLVEICGNDLLEDAVRVRAHVSGPGWEIDAGRRADRVAARICREPQLSVRELERSKQGTEFLVSNLAALGEVVTSHNRLDDKQIDMLYTLLGVPYEVRSGSLKVPKGNDGPALVALINRELARLQRKLAHTLDGQDRAEQKVATDLGSPYRDKTTRYLRSDEARNLKRLQWAERALDQVRSGVPPSTIIDPRTKSPIDPHAGGIPTSKPNPAPAAAPPTPPPPNEDPPPGPPQKLPDFQPGMPAEVRATMLVAAGSIGELQAAFRAAQAAREAARAQSAEPEAGPQPPL